jgi:glycine amidinotransferase/scyllo-inosamine-4-phosphate amidinotransferase 1
MKINSHNEWDPLRTIVVGTATNANWPLNDPIFNQESEKTTWRETPVPRGPVPQNIVDQANRELDQLCTVLYNLGVEVWRPDDINFIQRDGMYNYCPRDRLLIAGTTVVDPAMLYPCRDMEIEELQFVCDAAERVLHMPRNRGMIMDAANVCRLGNDWLYLLSSSGNQAALDWLQQQFPAKNIESCNFYSGVHIDSTVVPLQQGLVLLNGSRVNPDNVPRVFKDWDQIYVNHIAEREFYQYPYASKWIGMNCLVVRPGLVIVDEIQTVLIEILKNRGIEVVALPLTHSRTLGGGFHCTTLDIHREA